MTNSAKVSVIIPTYNRTHFICEAIESVLAQTYQNFEIIVVDNGSTDDSVKAIREEFPQATLIENGANLGFAAGNNVGIRHALERGADYIWLLNNDTTVEPDSLSKLVTHAEAHPSAGMLNPVIMTYGKPDKIQVAGGWIDWNSGRARSINDQKSFNKISKEDRCLSGCALLVRKKVIEEIGLLDESFFFYNEDRDWSIRCTQHGYDLALVKEAIIYHKLTDSLGVESPKTWYLSSMSSFILLKKHRRRFGRLYRFKYVALSIQESLRLRREGLREASEAVLDASLQSFLPFPFSNSSSIKNTIKRFIQKHPHFFSDLFSFQFKSLAFEIKRRLFARVQKISKTLL